MPTDEEEVERAEIEFEGEYPPEEDDEYSELDEKEIQQQNFQPFSQPSLSSRLSAAQNKPKPMVATQNFNVSANINSQKGKSSALQALFQSQEESPVPSPKFSDSKDLNFKIPNNRPFASSPEEVETEDNNEHRPDVNLPKPHHFNGVFNQSLKQRDYDVELRQQREELEFQKQQGQQKYDEFMKNDELENPSKPTALPSKAKARRRDSKYTHDTNNYWTSFNTEDIINRIHSIDKSLSQTKDELDLKKEIVPRRSSLLSSSNLNLTTNSYDINQNDRDKQNQPSPLDHPSSNYAPKPFEQQNFNNSVNFQDWNQGEGGGGISPLYPNHIENPHVAKSAYNSAIEQENALNAITSKFQSSVDQQQYQHLFDKHRMESSGTITRLCLVEGPLVKSFEEYPLRVDLENSAVDVVWREPKQSSKLLKKSNSNNNKQGKKSAIRSGLGLAASSSEFLKRSLLSSPTQNKDGDIPALPSSIKKRKELENYYHNLINQIQTNNYSSMILRRERFLFDYIYTGNQSFGRLKEYMRYRIRYSLTNVINQVILCTSCAEYQPEELEP